MHRRAVAVALLLFVAALAHATPQARHRGPLPHGRRSHRGLSQRAPAFPAAGLVPEFFSADGGLDKNDDEEDARLEPTMADLLAAASHGDRNASRRLREAAATGVWARLRGHEARREDSDAFAVPAYETEAWATVLYARKLGPHERAPSAGHLSSNFRALLESASTVDWYFLTLLLAVVITMDLVILQQLPETSKTHVVLLLFWLLVAVVFCVEVWLRLGPQAGVGWITGYALEVILSVDNVFIIHLIFCTFETPRRLMAKALFIGLLSSMAFRLAFLLGLASALENLKVIPYLMGVWLIYCGTRQVTVHEDEGADVTQTPIVRSFRSLLGERLGEFYDEEGEAMLTFSKGKLCMTLLGIVVLCLLVTDFFLAFDVVLTKADELQNGYLNFSSSALALFAVRAVYFMARDVFSRFFFARYGIGIVLLFMGAETLLSRAIYVNALLSCTVIAVVVLLSMFFSWLRGPCPKILQ